MRATPPLLVLSLMLAGCQSGPPAPAATGVVQPTVAGVPAPTYACAADGRRAFTRACGSVTAVLEDASWLMFEGDPATVEANHRGYFDYGYTTFQVELRSKEFTQPTAETFQLEDNLGRRVPGRPLSYEGAPVLVDDRYFSTFTLSFQHTLSREVAWIRLTRLADASSVEWQFAHANDKPCQPPR